MKNPSDSRTIPVDGPDSPPSAPLPPDPAAAELAAEKDRYLRLAADFDNFRKRTARDSGQRAQAQKGEFIRELLPIVDNLERALAGDSRVSDAQVRRGLEMILQQLADLLKRHGVEAVNPLGLTFDPQRHEAISARFDRAQADHTVVDVVQRGYRRGDEILRPAQVIINDHTLSRG